MMLHHLHWHPPGACRLPWIINQRTTALSTPQYAFWKDAHASMVAHPGECLIVPTSPPFFSQLIKIVLVTSKNTVKWCSFWLLLTTVFLFEFCLEETAVCYENKFISFPFFFLASCLRDTVRCSQLVASVRSQFWHFLVLYWEGGLLF